MSWKEALRGYAATAQYWAYRGVHDLTSVVYSLAWDSYNWIDGNRTILRDSVYNWRYSMPGFLEPVTGWLSDRFNDVLWSATDMALAPVVRIIQWFNDRYNTERQSWNWSILVFDAMGYVVLLAGNVGSHIDGLPVEVSGWIWAIINPALDPVGWGVGEAANRLAGGTGNLWLYFKSISTNNYTALQAQTLNLGDVIRTRFQDAEAAINGLLDSVLDLVGQALGAYYQLIAAYSVNPWPAYRLTYGSARLAILPLLHDAGLSVLTRIDTTFDNAIDLGRSYTDALRGDILLWATGIQSSIDWIDDAAADLDSFRQDPATYIWDRLSPGLLARLEPWLSQRWDLG